MSLFRAHQTVALALTMLAMALASLFLGHTASVQALAPKTIEFVSSMGGSITSVAISGTVVFAGQGYALASFEASDPSHILPLSYVPLPDFAARIEVSGTNAFVADGIGGLQIVDISDPHHLQSRASYATGDEANDVSVSGNRAYLAVHSPSDTALHVIDVANPAAPALLGTFSLGSGWQQAAIEVKDNTAFLGDYRGLTVVDVGDPIHPAKVGALSLASGTRDLQVTGDRVVSFSNGPTSYELDVIDAHAPMSPTLIGKRVGFGELSDLAALEVVGDLAYASDSYKSLVVFDLTVPTTPTLKNKSSFPALDIRVVGSRGFLAGTGGALQVVDFDAEALASLAGKYALFAGVLNVQVKWPYAYIPGGSQFLQIVDISNPVSPTLVDTGSCQGDARDLAIDGNVLYLNRLSQALDIFDITTPGCPALLATYNPPSHGTYTAITAAGNYAYVGELNSGINILDVSNPAAPAYKSTAGPISGSGPQYIKRKGNILYVAAGNGGLVTVDVSNPLTPSVAGRVGAGEFWASGLDVVQDLAFVSGTNDGLYAIDVANPIYPTVLAKYPTSNTQLGQVLAIGDKVVVAESFKGLLILDMSEPSNPTLSRHFPIACTLGDFDIVDDYIYLACGAGGFRIFHLPGISPSNTSKSYLPVLSR